MTDTLETPCILSDLTVTEAHLRLEFAEWDSFGPLPIWELRGLLGHALWAHLHAALPEAEARAAYQAAFKPPQGTPHPLLTHCPCGMSSLGDALCAVLRFYGSGERWLRPCIDALHAFESHGFGPHRRPYRLRVDTAGQADTPWRAGWTPRANGRFSLVFETPVRLKYRNAALEPDGPLLYALVRSALQHFQDTAACYASEHTVGDGAAKQLAVQGRITRAALAPVEAWRRSTVSGAEVSLGGWAGWIELDGGPELERLFRAAELLGLGNKKAQGNGRVRVRYD